jgi:hypothetical protein
MKKLVLLLFVISNLAIAGNRSISIVAPPSSEPEPSCMKDTFNGDEAYTCIQDTLIKTKYALNRIYERALRKDISLEGTIIFKYSEKLNTYIEESELKSSELEALFVKRLQLTDYGNLKEIFSDQQHSVYFSYGKI